MAQRRPEPGISGNTIRKAFIEILQATGLTDAFGEPLKFQPHDFRRIFTTEAILNGIPPHIAQPILGHKDSRRPSTATGPSSPAAERCGRTRNTEGWLGEAEGLRVSLAAAKVKLVQLDERTRRATTINLGLPAFRQVAGRAATLPERRP
ncbi:tyrosine-type recombinase/integrase [Microbispora hainanensis]|uniref:tyrosine-type recombinase/integrase n=1 Tax=Microbispora hainanensis TaxID=568844 RepID=UPI001ABFD03A|nr:tyrosine-type recombinase/integrase [Microbispora hainanensis]